MGILGKSIPENDLVLEMIYNSLKKNLIEFPQNRLVEPMSPNRMIPRGTLVLLGIPQLGSHPKPADSRTCGLAHLRTRAPVDSCTRGLVHPIVYAPASVPPVALRVARRGVVGIQNTYTSIRSYQYPVSRSLTFARSDINRFLSISDQHIARKSDNQLVRI